MDSAKWNRGSSAKAAATLRRGRSASSTDSVNPPESATLGTLTVRAHTAFTIIPVVMSVVFERAALARVTASSTMRRWPC